MPLLGIIVAVFIVVAASASGSKYREQDARRLQS